LGNTNVSDMIFLDIFRRNTNLKTFNIFSLEDEGKCFDFNANVPSNGWRKTFKMNRLYGIKAIEKKNESLYVEDASGEKVKFYTLHFQGYITKALITNYLTYVTGFEKLQNTLLAYYTFVVRTMQLKKNWLRDKLKFSK
jgi:hypothetical protein